MLNYFCDLLRVLKSIEKHLSCIARCVRLDHHSFGDDASISVKHWNT